MRTIRTSLASLIMLAACGGGGGGGDGDDDGDSDAQELPVDGPSSNPLEGASAVTMIDDGYMFVEGPQWRDATGDLLFSDIPAGIIYRWVPGGGAPATFRAASGNSNGLAIDPAGVLVACEHGNRRVSRGDGAQPTTVVEMFDGHRLNSPNDAVVRADGNIYFTDPPFGITDDQRELDFMGTFRVDPAGAVTTVRQGAQIERPNGIALSPDGSRLYVGDATLGLVRAYDVDAAGVTSNERNLVFPGPTPDGMAVDAAGNIYIATADGVEVFADDGGRWGVLLVPQQPSNVAFGGADHKTLFITAQTAVYQVTLTVPGLPRN